VQNTMTTAKLAFSIFLSVLGHAEAQQPATQSSIAPRVIGQDDRCTEFSRILGEVGGPQSLPSPDEVEKKYRRLAEAAKVGEDCAKSIAEAFRTLRGKGGSVSWSQIESELDKLITAQKSFIEKIEGTGGLIEEATRGESVLHQRIEEAQRRYPEEVPKEKERLTRLQSISGATQAHKDGLAQLIRDLQAAKPKLAFSESGKQFDATLDELEKFNHALKDLTGKCPRRLRAIPECRSLSGVAEEESRENTIRTVLTGFTPCRSRSSCVRPSGTRRLPAENDRCSVDR
jgi:hypothetical protein